MQVEKVLVGNGFVDEATNMRGRLKTFSPNLGVLKIVLFSQIFGMLQIPVKTDMIQQMRRF